MCGIFALLNNDKHFTSTFIDSQFQKGRSRGPEFSKLTNAMIKLQFGFHRLAINGLNDESNQPIVYHDMALICNGEIYNYRELYAEMGITPTTNSDCEIILHLYERYDMEKTVQMLDGVFAFALVDYRFDKTVSKLFVARDPYGVRPLFQLSPEYSGYNENQVFLFASEIKMLSECQNELVKNVENYIIEPFLPGTFSVFELPFKVSAYWQLIRSQKYHTMPFSSMIENPRIKNQIFTDIQYHFINAIEKRCCTTERPIACLLSGGLDSSLVAALVNEYHLRKGLPTLETYSIGLSGSVDLVYAKKVADYLGTKHTEIVLSEPEFLSAIPSVIYAIESYDTTTVRASIGNWLLGKYIAANSQAKVIFNGDGADELMGGYLYMRFADNAVEFDMECRRLLTDIHYFDVLRSDRCISSHGLEPRTPFLDRAWVQYYLSLPANLRFHGKEQQREKHLIRHAFSLPFFTNGLGQALLPNEILWRKKEAFSDGVSQESRSLFQIIQEYLDRTTPINVYVENRLYYDHLQPETREQCYYRRLFELHYAGAENVIPYYWMPKYVAAKDASARTLVCYQEKEENDVELAISV
jgi:asparagine synthase (glutamine-hydrolysing)